MVFFLAAVGLVAALSGALPSPVSVPSSGISIVADNDLLGPGGPSSSAGVIALHGKHTLTEAKAVCQAIGEGLWPGAASGRVGTDFGNVLGALRYEWALGEERFWIHLDGELWGRALNLRDGEVDRLVGNGGSEAKFSALCTQTAPLSNDTCQDTSERWQVGVLANNETVIGIRDRYTFRFLGVRYAPDPPKLAHSIPYVGSGGTQLALAHGPWCIQADLGKADCLFLNVYTTYLPGEELPTTTATSPPKLKSVVLYLHGGGFLTGYGSDPTFDGGNLASRGDVVVVSINYRLGAVGFLAINDGVTNGNYGLGDMLLALDWVRAHIHAFGGDKDKITLMGSSAGANAIRALLGSPRAKGKFAAAAMLSLCSGLAGAGVLQKYYSIDEIMEVASNKALAAAGCANATATNSSTSQVECLRALDSRDLWWAGLEARLLTIDGDILTTDEFGLFRPGGSFAGDVPVMMGINAEDGLSLISYPSLPPNATADDFSWLTSQGLPDPSKGNRTTPLYPVETALQNQTLAVYRMWARLATDVFFRCSDQAHVHAALRTRAFGGGGGGRGGAGGGGGAAKVWYYEFERTYQPPEWPGLNLCEAPRTAEHPAGDLTSVEGNLRCHNGETLFVFGNQARRGLPFRDEEEVAFERYVLDSFATFARTHDPNPDKEFLLARGYGSTVEMLERAGRWMPATSTTRLGDDDGAIVKIFDVPPKKGQGKGESSSGTMMRGWKDVEECEWMGLPLDFWMPR